MDNRRKVKDKDKSTYRQIGKDIRQAIREAKNKWMEERCQKIETLEHQHDLFNLHKKVKEAARLYKPKTPGCMTDNQGHPILDI